MDVISVDIFPIVDVFSVDLFSVDLFSEHHLNERCIKAKSQLIIQGTKFTHNCRRNVCRSTGLSSKSPHPLVPDAHYPHMPIGKVWIYRLHVCVC